MIYNLEGNEVAMYDVVRYFYNGRRRTIIRNISLEEAQAHCHNPETSWRTCTTAVGKARTRRCGEWFDGFTDHRSKR
jgi:hypothetical protein